jgi:hypothetical protein
MPTLIAKYTQRTNGGLVYILHNMWHFLNIHVPNKAPNHTMKEKRHQQLIENIIYMFKIGAYVLLAGGIVFQYGLCK